ncbi:MAG TPA: S8 family serine peptidase [Xanthobacteraceae bacterium]|jgi:subtilisin family serine protease
MTIEQRYSGEQGPAAGSASRPRRCYRSLRAIALTWVSIAAAPILWASVDSAAAMGFHGFHAAGTHQQAARRQASRASGQAFHWSIRRLRSHVVRLRPGGGEMSLRRPFQPRRPIVIGPLPGPAAPIGVVSAQPPGLLGPSGTSTSAAGASSAVARGNDRRFVPDEVLVSFAANIPPQAIVSLAQDQRLALLGVHRLPLINTVLYRFRITDRRQVPVVVGDLQSDRRIAAVQPNYVYTLQDAGAPAGAVGDPMQYVVSKLHLPQAHALATGDHVLVAVIDSGIDARHPELSGAVAGGFDAFGGDAAPHRHGTAMASAIAGHGRLMGVAPSARILAVRAFEGEAGGAHGTTTRVLDALQWTVHSAARVVNMSFTGPPDPEVHKIIAAARQKGMVLVAAAGNDGPRAAPDYPAAYPEVIAVTATDIDDRLLSVANHGAYVSVAAPGVEIFVAAPQGGYGFTTGTSVATAHVSGLAALLLERDPRLTPAAVQAILMKTARDLGPKGRDDEYGAGLVDAYAALLALAPPTALNTLTH